MSLAKELNPQLNITVNILAPTLQERELRCLLLKWLAKYQVASQYVIIELIQTASIENLQQVLHNLAAIDVWGVQIALDAFGVGFPSFSYLKKCL